MKLVIFLTLLWYTEAQKVTSIDPLIYSIFTKATPAPPENKNKPGATGGGNKGIPGECECVPYYKCYGTKINRVGVIDIIVDNGPCDYLDVCCKLPDKRKKEDPSPVQLPSKKPGKCGQRNPKGLGFQIGGWNDHDALYGEFPWMVAVLREESVENTPIKLLVYQSGASLIHPQVVLTAAHWVSDKEKKFKVRAGEWDTQTKYEIYPHQDRNVTQIKIHPEYDSGGFYFDYALLFVNAPFDIAENVDTVCLPPPDTYVNPGSRCFASGWGKDLFGKEGEYQVLLNKVDLPIVDKEKCQNELSKTRVGPNFVLHETFICAGGEPGKDTCKVDGGSPLVCPIAGSPGKYEQRGIIVWGIGCGASSTPIVVATISKAYNWIEEELKLRNYDTSFYRP